MKAYAIKYVNLQNSMHVKNVWLMNVLVMFTYFNGSFLLEIYLGAGIF